MAPPAAAQGAAEPEEVHVPEYNPHRVFIRLEDLERHGFTAGCRRCILMREGRKSQGIKHRDECRNRVEQALRDAGDARLDRAERRVMDELGRRADEDGPPEAEAAPPGDPGAGQAEEAPAPATPVAGGDDMYMDDGDGGDAMMRLEPAKVAEPYSPPWVTATLPRL